MLLKNDYFILVAGNGVKLLDDRPVPGYDVLKYRLQNGLWALNKRTRCVRQIQRGAKLIFYVSGSLTHSKHFVASAEAASNLLPFTNEDLPNYDALNLWYPSSPTYKMPLCNIKWFNKFVDIETAKNELMFFRKLSAGNKWGAVFVGGALNISAADYERICVLGQ